MVEPSAFVTQWTCSMILIQITEVNDKNNAVENARVLCIDDVGQYAHESLDEIRCFLEKTLPDIFVEGD